MSFEAFGLSRYAPFAMVSRVSYRHPSNESSPLCGPLVFYSIYQTLPFSFVSFFDCSLPNEILLAFHRHELDESGNEIVKTERKIFLSVWPSFFTFFVPLLPFSNFFDGSETFGSPKLTKRQL